MCFGDMPASTVLLLAYSNFVLPLLTSSSSRKALSASHVEDSLSVSRDKVLLDKSVSEILDKLAIFGVVPKFVLHSGETPTVEKTMIFHQTWGLKTDCILPSTDFNVFGENRGVHKGPMLTAMPNLSNVKVIKTLLARLLGLLFDMYELLFYLYLPKYVRL